MINGIPIEDFTDFEDQALIVDVTSGSSPSPSLADPTEVDSIDSFFTTRLDTEQPPKLSRLDKMKAMKDAFKNKVASVKASIKAKATTTIQEEAVHELGESSQMERNAEIQSDSTIEVDGPPTEARRLHRARYRNCSKILESPADYQPEEIEQARAFMLEELDRAVQKDTILQVQRQEHVEEVGRVHDDYNNTFVRTIDAIALFFEKVKPCTMVSLIRAIISGTKIQKITGIVAILEQAGIMYSMTNLQDTYLHVVDFFIYLNSSFAGTITSLIESQASLKQSFENLTGLDLGDLGETKTKAASAALGFSCLLTGGLINFASASKKDFAAFLKGFENLAKTTTAVGRSVDIFKDLTVWLLTHCGFEFAHTKEVKEKLAAMYTFADDLEERLEESKANPYKLYDGTIEPNALMMTAKDYEDWFHAVNKTGELRTASALIARVITARTSMMKTIKTVDRSVGVKQVPAVVWMWGKAGCGKSTAIQKIINELEKLEGRPMTVYTRAISDKYWSGYEQQDIVIYDDFSVDSANTDDATELMRAVTNSAYQLNMAELSDKGKMFKSRYILIASNYDTTTAQTMDFEAIVRRRDIPLMCWNPSVDNFVTAGGMIQDYEDWDNFLPNFHCQKYGYRATQQGRLDHASAVQFYDRPFVGLPGLQAVAKKLFDKQVVRRAKFIVELNEKKKAVTLFVGNQDTSIGPGVHRDDLEPDEEEEEQQPPAEEDGLLDQAQGGDDGSADLNDAVAGLAINAEEIMANVDRIARPDHRADIEARNKIARKAKKKPPGNNRGGNRRGGRAFPHDTLEVPKIFVLFGDSTTGKTTLGKQMYQGTEKKDAAHLDDPLDTPDEYQHIATLIKDHADAGIPLIITVNNDQWYAFLLWLKEKSVDMWERTLRRIKCYRFERRTKGLWLKSKMTTEEVKAAPNFQNAVSITYWDMRNDKPMSGHDIYTRDQLIDSFKDLLMEKLVLSYERKGMTCVRLPVKVTLDFHTITLGERPSTSQLMGCLSLHQLRSLAHLRGIIAHVSSTLRHTAFNDISIEGMVRQANSCQIKASFDETVRVKFAEGDFYIASIGGYLRAAAGVRTEIITKAGHKFFKTGEEEIEMTKQEIEFHQLMTGEQLDCSECYVPPEDIPIGKVPFRTTALVVVDKILGSVATLFAAGVIVANIVEMVKEHQDPPLPEGRKARTRAAMDNAFMDYEPTEAAWGDIVPDDDMGFFYAAKPTEKITRTQYRCHCRQGYDCALCTGSLPMYIASEAKKQYFVVTPLSERSYIKTESSYRGPPNPSVNAESHDVSLRTTKSLRVESNETMTTTRKPIVKVETDVNDYVKNRRVQPRNGEEIFKELLEQEKYHVIKDRKWCPQYTTKNAGKVDGGTQIGHHRCRQCRQLVLRLWNHRDVANRVCFACRGHDMPQDYFHTECKKCAKEIQSEGCLDPAIRDVIHKSNANSVAFDGFFGLMLYGTLGVAPNHCFYSDSMTTSAGHLCKVVKRDLKKDLVYFQISANGHPLTKAKDIRKFIMKRGERIQTTSMALLILNPVETPIMAPVEIVQETTIKPMAMPDDIDVIQTRMSKGGTFNSYISRAGDCGCVLYQLNNQSVHKLIGMHVAGSDTFGYVSNLIQEDIPDDVRFQSGLIEKLIDRNIDLYYGDAAEQWCPIQSEDGTRRNPITHLCAKCHKYVLELQIDTGGRRSICYSCVGVPMPEFYFHDKPSCKLCKTAKQSEDPEYFALPTMQVQPAEGEIGTFKVVAKIINHTGHPVTKKLPGKTKLRESPFRTDMYGTPFEPAILSVDDKRSNGVDPYIKNVDKWDRERPKLDQDEFTEMAVEMGEWYAHEIKKRRLPIGKLTLEEAINRDTRHAKSNPIAMHTSAGYPYSRLPGVKEKSPMIFFDQAANRYKLNRDVYEGWLVGRHIEYIVDKAKQGKKTAVVFDVNLKDEALPKAKIDMVKTRSIVGSPLCFTLAHRMYLHTAGCAIMEMVDETPIKIGIAPNTIQWHNLYRWLTRYNDYGTDADYRHWDASITAEEITAAGEFYNVIFRKCDPDWCEEDEVVRRTFYQILSKPLLTRGADIVQSTGGIVSGQPFTGLDNSVINCLRCWFAWRKYVDFKRMPSFKKTWQSFLDDVSLAVNGDDNLLMPKPQYPDFSFKFIKEAVRELGAEYTPAKKDAADTEAQQHITDMTFLKRHFLLLEETKPYCSGGLTDDAFCKLTSNARVLDAKPYEVIKGRVMFEPHTIGQTVETYLVEASLRGKEFYYRATEHCDRVCYDYYIDVPKPKKWENAFNAVFHHYETRYIDVFM